MIISRTGSSDVVVHAMQATVARLAAFQLIFLCNIIIQYNINHTSYSDSFSTEFLKLCVMIADGLLRINTIDDHWHCSRLMPLAVQFSTYNSS